MSRTQSIIRGIYRKAYEELEVDTGYFDPLNAEIDHIMVPLSGMDNYEDISDIVYDAVNAGQEYAFEAGFKFAVALFLESVIE